MSDRLPSGSERLDLVLGGGLLANGINLVIGRPGTGKTILAQQYLFHNATDERPALYLSTVSEPLEKILRYGQSLAFFDKTAVGSRVVYDDLGAILNEDGLAGVLNRLTGMLRERQPALLVIDSFKAMRAYAPDEGSFRRFLHDLAGQLSAMAITSFWIGEYDSAETDAPEFAVADAIVALNVQRRAERVTRVFEVVKFRGSDFVSGQHAYRLSENGLDAFPRLADFGEVDSYAMTSNRATSGVVLLDEMLADGFWQGSSTLVAGPSGSGKTLLALHFVFAGAQLGERCVFATFQENPVQLERIARGFSWSLEHPGVELLYRPPVDLYVDEWVYELLDTIERTGAKRVVIDSLGDLRAACGDDELRFREYMYSLLQRCARNSISVVLTQEAAELFGMTQLAEYGISHLSDNVVLFQFLRGDSEIKRAITILKTRASTHDPRIRQFDITTDGFTVGAPFAPEQSLR